MFAHMFDLIEAIRTAFAVFREFCEEAARALMKIELAL
jgi:hypothetical protein